MTRASGEADARPPRTGPLLSIRGLNVDFSGKQVLQDVNLDVAHGEMVVVLGSSGSGKSTLLWSILDLIPRPGRVTARSIELHDGDTSVDLVGMGKRQRREVYGREIGTVLQDPSLALSPLRRVESLLAEASPPGAATPERFDLLLRQAGFTDPRVALPRRSYELSGGMAQRVALALVAAQSPRLWLADEPTTALDGLARKELLRQLRARVDEGGGLVLVTHDISIATEADTIVVISDGCIVDSGTPADVLGSSKNPATRRLLENLPWSLPPRRRRDPAPHTTSAPPILQVRGVRHSYGSGPEILRGVDLKCAPGEVVGLAGASGSGKSTLLKCLVGLEQAASGEIQIDEKDPRESGWHEVRRIMQLVPQDPRAALNPWRTALQLVTDPLDFHKIGLRRRRQVRAMDLLERVGLGTLAHRRPNELSTGQLQRVCIARALAVEPRFLVADEPSSALDVEVQAEILRLLSEIVDELGMAALIVSHDLHVIERLCDRVLVLFEGEVVEDIPTDDLRRHATHPQTRRLLAAYPADPIAAATGGRAERWSSCDPEPRPTTPSPRIVHRPRRGALMYEFRRATTPEELHQARETVLHAMTFDLGYGYQPEWHWDLDHAVEMYLDNPRQAMFIAVAPDGHVASTSAIRVGGPRAPHPQWLIDRYADRANVSQIIRVATHPDHRRQGLARRLVALCQQFAREDGGFRTIYGHTNLRVEAAGGFWRSFPIIETLDASDSETDERFLTLHFELPLDADIPLRREPDDAASAALATADEVTL